MALGIGCPASVPGQCASDAQCAPGEHCTTASNPAQCEPNLVDGGGSDAGCPIAGGSYAEGAGNPSNACQLCLSERDATGWSNRADGAPCSESGGQVCRGGQCTPGCSINGTAVAPQAPNPLNPCETCQPAVSGTAYSIAPDLTPCQSNNGNLCQSGVCRLGCVTDAGFVNSWAFRDELQSACCNVQLDPTGWSAAFGSAVTLPIGASPLALAVADFNGDGRTDVAVALGQPALAVFLSLGDGGFKALPLVPAPPTPKALASGEWADGGPLAVAALSAAGTLSSIALFATLEDGTLVDAGALPVPGAPAALALGPLAVGQPASFAEVGGNAAGVLTIWANAGEGQFGSLPSSQLAIDPEPIALALGAFRDAGLNDVAVLATMGTTLDLALATAPGSFTSFSSTPLTRPANALVAAQFVAGGLADAVVGGSSVDGGFIQRLGNLGNGHFREDEIAYVGEQVAQLAHFRRAGAAVDTLVAVDGLTGDLEVQAPGSDGFHSPAVYASGANGISGLAVGDYNGDQLVDLLVSDPVNNAVYLLPGQCK